MHHSDAKPLLRCPWNIIQYNITICSLYKTQSQLSTVHQPFHFCRIERKC